MGLGFLLEVSLPDFLMAHHVTARYSSEKDLIPTCCARTVIIFEGLGKSLRPDLR